MEKKTERLLELMKQTDNYKDFANEHKSDYSYMKTDRALNLLIKEKGLKKAEVIAKSGVEVHYGYQVLSGGKSPSRDKVIMLCLGMGLSFEEVQEFLKITGRAVLYVRDERDNALAFGFLKHLSVIEVNSLLYELNLELLI